MYAVQCAVLAITLRRHEAGHGALRPLRRRLMEITERANSEKLMRHVLVAQTLQDAETEKGIVGLECEIA
jgi:hypothetical protein